MNTVVNSVRLLGNLGKDPIIKSFSNGGKVANCTLATPHLSKDKDGNKVEETDWHLIVIRGKMAEVAEKYLTKGSQIAVEGSLRSRKYNDSDGNERYITEVIVSDMQMLGGKKDK
ncbi:MAG TPA: single-stranded DNA-binding protein [Catalimonadaceae bacterium]|nr:single-stranded DNA-binding protein [Catalimonadaceae bacterium]